MGDAIEGRIEALVKGRKDPKCLRVSIGGGSGSGKSTVAAIMKEKLQPLVVEVLRLDRFFKPPEQMPKYYSEYLKGHRPDFNQPDSLDAPAMFLFCRNLSGPDVIIFDGHFSLYYPEMRELMDIRCFVTVDVEAMLNRRTERNLANNYGGDRDNILNYNRECVLPSYQTHILPTRAHADLLIPNDESEISQRDHLLDSLCTKILANPRSGE